MRLFFASELPESVRAALGAAQRRLGRVEGGGRSAVKWTRPEGMHLTLRFLGETDPNAVNPLLAAVAPGVETSASLSLRLGSCGAFPPSGPARVVWAGLEGDLERLADLAGAVEKAVVACGFRPEARPFRPHVTLARIEDRPAGSALRRRLEAERETILEPGRATMFPLTEVVLFESRLGAGAARYTALGRLPLKGSA